jgi:hypothetical protein
MKIPSILLLLAVLTFSISTQAAPPSDQSINQLNFTARVLHFPLLSPPNVV